MAAMNESFKLAQVKPYEELTAHLWGYVIQGILLVLSNSVIFTSILYHELLRSKKEYALPALLAFRDAVDGLAAIMAGVGRNWLIFNGRAADGVSKWHCLLTPWDFIWVFSDHTTDSIFLMISIDRLIAIGLPLFHYGLNKTYSNMLVLLAIFPAFVGYTHSFTYTLGHNNSTNVAAICYTSFVYSGDYYNVMYFTKVIVTFLSVVLYIPVTVLYLRHNSDVSGITNQEEAKKYIKSQRKFTVTLGISCLLTTVLYVVPRMVRAMLPYFISVSSSEGLIISSSAYMVENFNKIANVFLYSLRHRNLRLGIKFLFKRKQLTLQAIQYADNAIVTVNRLPPHQNQLRRENPQNIKLAFNTLNVPSNRRQTPIGIRRPVISRHVTTSHV